MLRVLSKQTLLIASLLALPIGLAGCSSSSKVSEIGKPPALSNIGDPTASPGYKPVTLPMPAPEPAVYTANSLWRSNDQSFFRDGRARRVGDILTINVTIDDEAEFENTTDRTRTAGRGLGVGTGLLGSLFNLIPGIGDTSAVVSLNANTNTNGDGSIERSEELTTTIAAVIVQKLPNGNLVIEGKQEVRVNFEVRELIVAGIIRPDDIQPNNTIESTKIAQARISYGGRGHLTDVQQPGYGQQIVDIVAPF
ncbi:MAG: flagellar basal body L-ring protein FlgH [Hyphomicrobiales bacterium]